jgi:hypothetical protein
MQLEVFKAGFPRIRTVGVRVAGIKFVQ